MSVAGGPTLAERLETVRSGVADAAASAGRNADEITTVVVTKFHPVSLIRELAALGVREVGENRSQEGQAKAAQLADLGLHWHFVGQVQSKKARQVRSFADVVHSVDRESLVNALAPADSGNTGSTGGTGSTNDLNSPDNAGRIVIDCFVQVNLTDDPSRGGVAPGNLEPLVETVLAAEGLRLLGLMAVAPLGGEARAAFAHVRELSERIRPLAPHATSLSMGMSGDYAAAIAEGATHLRIGTAITGNRPETG